MHYSVLLNESIELLNIKPDGVYVDGTFGRGGHSRAILAQLGEAGRLIAFDKDPEAIAYAAKSIGDSRFQIIHGSFAQLKDVLAGQGLSGVDGILLDLGVSSPQLDTPERGFSFRFDAPLDMRMDNSSGISAAQWLNSAEECEIADVLWRYGEEKFSRRIAREIINQRQTKPLTTTSELANLVAKIMPFREKGQHPATRTFQGLRIKVNNELGDLESFLQTAGDLLNEQGRIVVISFHSLEDRIVKTSFATLASGENLPKWVLANPKESDFRVIARKVKAGIGELGENIRSRSAIMRTLERSRAKSD